MKIKEWLDIYSQLPGLVRDVVFVVLVVGGISVLSQITLGLWTPMVAVESGSMVPNLNIGDIVVVQGASRTVIETWEEAEGTGKLAFNHPGDVILYRPYGKERLGLTDQLAHIFLRKPYSPNKATPIIHRALRYVEEGDPMWEGGPPAPFPGYITKGDNNDMIDQKAGMIIGPANETMMWGPSSFLIEVGDQTYLGEGISYLTPVKEEWVIGAARFKIPYVGYVRLLPGIIVNQARNLLS